MIRKLRHKFIWISMLSVAAVLILLIGGMNVANYVSMNKSLDLRLGILTENGGALPEMPPFMDGKREEWERREPERPDGAFMREEGNMPGEGIERSKKRGLNAEAYFDIRYFTVSIFGGDNDNAVANIENISSVNEAKACEYALSLYEKKKTEGFIGNYKYKRIDGTEGEVCKYIFIDAERELTYFKNTLTSSISVSVSGLVLVFVLVYIFSKIAVRPMAESYDKQKRFITDASHELKTPLAIIDANTEVIEMESGESEWTESIHKQVKRLNSLTQKLVFLSRMDEGNTANFNMLDFDLSEAILDVAEGYKAMAISAEKELILDIDSGIKLHGDEANIRQMISLLMDNAMKYSSDKGVIRLSLKASNKWKNIKVYNTAEDVKQGKLDYLFDRFYRGDTSRNSKSGGFGIGLSVVQAIVLAHKGRISAKSEDGRSIVFSIYLP
ncbi:MAG: HAMP domain-containing histidine kinase [Lachnospiraceae bacterium]|nr:HAMP domain-containing histidine kinase [Lachnospiraceae bacterium]